MTPRERWTMVATVLGSAMVFLDGTIVNVALPAIGRELPATIVSTLEGQAYITSGYLATLAALLLLAGALADYYGRRRIFAIGLVGFGATSVLCGLAPSLELLAVFRVLQGASGALLVPGSLSVLTAVFDGPARARAFGIWTGATSATIVLGPIVGGFLVDAVSWRAAFLINLPLMAVALAATLREMPESRNDEATGRFDWLGAAVAVVAVGGLAFGAIRGQEQRWADPLAFASLAVGAVALVAFPWLMRRRPDALVPVELFANRRFSVVNLSTFLVYGALYVSLTFQALFLQNVLGYTALAAGATGLPTGILLTLLSTRVGTLAHRIGSRPFLAAGPAIMGLGFLWLARVPASSEAWRLSPADPATIVPPASMLVDILPAVLLGGIGICLVVAPLTATLMASAPVRHAGVASALNNAISRVGQPILTALIFIVVTAVFQASLAGALPGVDTSDPAFRASVQPLNPPIGDVSEAVRAAAQRASTDAFRFAVIVSAILLFAGALTNWLGLREGRPAGTEPDAGARRTDDEGADPAVPGMS